ncbi:STAS domain-containing protein [Actinokineospora sp. 24-640]
MTFLLPLPATALVTVLSGRPHPRHLLTVTAHPLPRRVVVLAVTGEVDLLTGPVLRDSLIAPLRNSIRHLVVDLTAVSFFDAAGIAVLVNIREAAMVAEAGLSIVANTRPVLMPLRVTGMDAGFDIHPDRAHAVSGARTKWMTRNSCGSAPPASESWTSTVTRQDR